MTAELAVSGGRRGAAARTMRVAVLTGPGSVSVRRAPVPEPGAGELLVELEGCGVCGSDLPQFEGRPWFGYPREPGAPGHEGWGTVRAAGTGAPQRLVGRRVAILGYRSYAQYDVVPAAAAVELPDAIPPGMPFPGEALGCAMNVFARSRISPGDSVAVVGTGFLGCLLVTLAARAGARVLAVSRRETARRAALAMGAKEAVAPQDAGGGGGGGDAHHDVVIEAAGAQDTLDLAARLTRVRGRLVIAGYHQDGPRTVDMQLWNWRGLDVVNAHERDPAIYVVGIRAAAQAVADGRLDPAPLYTHSFRLDRLDEALRAAVERPAGFIKAVVCP